MAVRVRRTPNGRFWLVFGAAFLLGACWSFARPLMAPADETAHARKAEAVVRGQFLGDDVTVRRPVGDEGQIFFAPFTDVRVPRAIDANPPLDECYWMDPRQPASCAPAVGTSHAPSVQQTYVGRYPPVYYLLVGLPSLANPGRAGLYAMRLLSALWSALFVASGVTSLLRRDRPRTAVALLAAVPPIAYALSGAINPSGLEMCSAFALWCALVGLVRPNAGAVSPNRLALRAGLAGVVLVGVRGLSPLWLVGAVAAALLSADLGSLRKLWERQAVRTWTVLVAVATGVAVAWVLLAKSYLVLGISMPPSMSTGALVRDAAGRTWNWGGQAIAPWGPSFAPARPVTFVWWLVIAALVVPALAAGVRQRRSVDAGRRAVVLALVIVVCLVLPVAVTVIGDRNYGPGWMGRYLWPFELGGLLLGSSLGDDVAIEAPAGVAQPRPIVERAARVGVVALGAVSLVELCLLLRRYTVGTAGPVLFWPGVWRPVVPVLAIIAAAVVAIAALVAAVWPGTGMVPEHPATGLATAGSPPDRVLSAATSPGHARTGG